MKRRWKNTRSVAAAMLATLALGSGHALADSYSSGNASWTTNLNGYYGGTAYDTSWIGDSYNNGSPTNTTYTNADGSTANVTSTFRGGNYDNAYGYNQKLDLSGNYLPAASQLYLQSFNQAGGAGVLTLKLATPQDYFGALVDVFAAGTSSISFYSGNTNLLTVDTTKLGTLVTPKTPNYFGNYDPTYVSYLNVAFGKNVRFDKVVLANANGLSDPSHYFYNEVSAVDIFMSPTLGNAQFASNQGTGAVPEPGESGLLLAGLGSLAIGMLGMNGRRRDGMPPAAHCS